MVGSDVDHVPLRRERAFFIDNRIHYIIVMIGWTGLAPWEFEFPFPGSLTSTFLEQAANIAGSGRRGARGQPVGPRLPPKIPAALGIYPFPASDCLI